MQVQEAGCPRWSRHGRKSLGESSGLEVEMREGDFTRDEVTWSRMVSLEGVGTGIGTARDLWDDV